MATLEDVLAARAMKDGQAGPNMGQSAMIGGGLGALAGLANPIGGISGRMAGGLIGTILGGGLGAGTKALFTETSDAGRLLAKIHTGSLTDIDRYALEQILADAYTNPGSLV